MSTNNELRMVPRMPLMVLEKILRYISRTKDKSICRLVCMNWLYTIDVHVGLGLKLTRANKAKLFASGLLRSCTSLKILESAGMLNWYVCYFNPTNLKSVEIVGNILIDNWKLLLQSCKSMQLLTITLHILTINHQKHLLPISSKPLNFPAQFSEDKIDHYCLRRLVFKNINELENIDIISTSHILNTLGIFPHLRQIIFISAFPPVHVHLTPSKNKMKHALLSLMQRNPEVNSVGLLRTTTSYSDMHIWDRFLSENKSCLVQSHGICSEWHEIFERLLMIDTLYYGIFSEVHRTGFITLMENIARESQNLTKLFLVLFCYRLEFDCRLLLLQGLANLIELSLCNFQFIERALLWPRLLNLNILTSANIRLQYLYISITLGEANMDAIFAIPQLKELHIKYQDSASDFKKRHVEMIINHNHLKLIFWQKSFQQKWNLFITECIGENWKFIQLKEKKPLKRVFSRWMGAEFPEIFIADQGCILEIKYKAMFADNFVVFNNQRLEEADWTRLGDLSKSKVA